MIRKSSEIVRKADKKDSLSPCLTNWDSIQKQALGEGNLKKNTNFCG
jgi:hypothetical protein